METIDTKKLEDAGAPKEVVEVYKLLKLYREDEDRKWWNDDVYTRGWEAAYENKIWEEDEEEAMKDKGMIPLAVNDLAKGVQGSVAVATANKPGVQIKPVGSGDLYVAELLQRGFDYVWEVNRGDKRLQRFVKHNKVGAVSVLDAKYDESKGKYGKIEIKNLKPTYVYWDKDCEEDDLSDSPIIKASLVTRTYAKENYDVTDDDLSYSPIEAEEEEGGKTSYNTGVDNYAEPGEDKAIEPVTGAEKKDVWEIEAWLIKQVKQYEIVYSPDNNPINIRRDKVDKKDEADQAKEALIAQGIVADVKARNVMKRVQRVIVGKKMISEEFNPYGVDSNGDPIFLPIVLQHDETLRGYPVCPTYFAREISRERNKRRSQAIYIVTKNVDAPIVVQGAYKWVKDKKQGDILEIGKDVSVPPHRLLPGNTASENLLLEKEAAEDIKNIYDVQDVVVGKMPATDPSGRSILALQDMAGMMSKPFISDMEWAVCRLAKVVLSMMLKYWPREMWERLVEPDEWTKWQPKEKPNIDPNTGQPIKMPGEEIIRKWAAALESIRPLNPQGKQLDIIDLDVRVIAGSTMPTSRMAKQAVASDMVKSGIYDREAALEYMDDPQKDKIIERTKQMDAMMAQAEAQKGMK